MKLMSDWTIVGSVEGGEILARESKGQILVSFPSLMNEAALRDFLSEKEIEVSENVEFHGGVSLYETAAVFDKP